MNNCAHINIEVGVGGERCLNCNKKGGGLVIPAYFIRKIREEDCTEMYYQNGGGRLFGEHIQRENEQV